MEVGFDHQPHGPAIYDTNIWIYGLTEERAACTNLVAAVIGGNQQVTVSAYVFEEVRRTLESGRVETTMAEEHMNDFASILYGGQNIDGPTQEEVRVMDVATVRNSPPAQAFGAATDSQPKDAPILWSAFQIAKNDCEVTIFTTDVEFSNCSPPPVDGDGTVIMEHIE